MFKFAFLSASRDQEAYLFVLLSALPVGQQQREEGISTVSFEPVVLGFDFYFWGLILYQNLVLKGMKLFSSSAGQSCSGKGRWETQVVPV